MTWTLAGRYRLTSSVASGPTGQLWRAVDSGTGHPVAVKLLHRFLASDTRVVDQLLGARRTLTELWHPGIARLIDVVVDDRAVGLVVDLVPGTDLGHLLATSGPLAPARAAGIAAAMADALQAAHLAGVVHGDVKPSNVIVAPHGAETVRMTDFSVAALVRVGRPHSTEGAASPYTPPWMIDGGVPTAASDVYALATVLHEMLTGTPSPADATVQVDPRLRELIERCRHGDRTAPPAPGEVAQQLRELIPHLSRSAPARRARTTPRPASTNTGHSGRSAPVSHASNAGHTLQATAGRRSRRRARVGLLAVTALLVAAGVTAVVGILNRADPDAPPGAENTTVAATDGAPSPPPEAAAHSEDGGAAFVQHWFAALTYAVSSGETAMLAQMTSPECQECQAAVETIDSVYAAGGRLRGGAYLVRNVSTANLWSLDRPVYDTTVDRSPRSAVDAAGAELPALSFHTCTVVLEWADERWLVREVVSPGCVG